MKIYFAHPCFTDEQREFKNQFMEKISAALTQNELSNNIIIIDPFEHTPVIEGDIETKMQMAESVKIECIRLLEECDVIIALVDNNDTGTAFEAGYAHAVNKPVILISQEHCSAANAMLIGAAKAIVNNVLEDEQILRLAELIKFSCSIWKTSQKKPDDN
jgi:nucleoside 2-deoxyribosyltransferase